MTLRRWHTRGDLRGAIWRRKPLLAMLVVLAVTTGACGHGLFSGSSSSSSSSGGGSGTTRSVYVTNFADGKLSSLNNTGGVPGSPVTIGAGKVKGPLGLVATPSLNALYVANTSDNKIHEFTIDSTGNLSTLGTIAAGTNPQQVVVTSDGFAYAINLAGSISQYAIGTNGGLTGNGSTTSGLTTPISGVASSSFVYVTDQAGGAGIVLTFAINGDGTLAAGPSSVFSLGVSGGNPGQITMDTSGAWVFVGDATSGVVSVFQVNGSGLTLFSQTAATGSPAGGLVFAVTPLGNQFLYVANPSLNTVSIFSFNSVLGLLTPFGTATGLSTPNGLAVDNASSANFLFATNTGNGTVSAFSINSSGGSLTSTGSSATESPANSGSSPEFILVTG